VKGWAGGDAWIDSATLLGRRQFVERVFRGSASASMKASTAAQDAKAPEPAGDGARARGMLQRGFGAYAFEAGAWPGPLETSAARQLDALVLALPPVETPAAASGIERLQGLVADP